MKTNILKTTHGALACAVEVPLSILELCTFFLLPCVWRAIPRGHSERVLLIPGFGEHDIHLHVLKCTLTRFGYHVDTWGLGTNTANHEVLIRLLIQKIRKEHRATGERIHLVGHSLGGIYALYLAHVLHKHVASVVTMGSPINPHLESINPVLLKTFQMVTRKPMLEHFKNPRLRFARTPPPLPMTTIAAYNDHIVGPASCMFPKGYAGMPDLDSVVTCDTHCGHIVSLATIMVILHHLAHTESPEPYNPCKYFSPMTAKCLYPSLPSL